VKDSAGHIHSDSLYVPSCTFIDEANALLFSEPLAKGNRLRVRYATYNFGMPRLYSLFDKRFAGSRDTLVMIRDSIFRIKTNEFADENVTLSGYKSINISVGTGGNMNLQQALDVTLSGEVAPQTTLSGHLTDQGTNIEGTRELSDFDRIYVQLDNPRYTLVVGDQYEYWPVAGGIFTGDQKKLTGISAEYKGGVSGGSPGFAGISSSRFSVQGFGAICGGKYTIQTIKGQATLQGPYYLTGEGEQGFIMPIRGSVSITVNGEKRVEGDQGDYSVDYQLGTITISPETIIQDNDLIRVEYQYRLFDYQRTLVGANVSGALPDSSVKATGGIWYEADDKNQPLNSSITAADMALMAQSGDSAPQYPSGQAILPVDVPQQSRIQPLYTMDSLGRYSFTEYNPNTPTQTTGFFAVWFREIGPGRGAYIVDQDSTKAHPELHSQIYKFVGQGIGTATDSTSIPLPQGTLTGEMRVSLAPHKWVSAVVDVAGMDVNNNLASSNGDNDNAGAATNAQIMLGKRLLDQRSMWITGSNMYVTPNFTREVISTYDGGVSWDDTTADMRSGLRQTWQSGAGGTVLPGTWAEISYGQLRHDDELHTDRISGDAQATFFKNYSLEYQGNLFRHLMWDENTRRDDINARAKLLGVDWGIFARDEWRMYQDSGSRGALGAGASLSWMPWMLKESAFYQLHRKGQGSELDAQDTGRTISWDQSISKKISSAWKVEATSHYLDVNIFNAQQTSATLVTASSDVTPAASGFTSHQEYRVNVEKSSTYQTTAVYAGPGRGDAVWSDSLHTYIAKQNGDYLLQQQQVYDTAGTDRVRKTRLLVNWSYAPEKKRGHGILRDLSWLGSLSCEENLSMGHPLGISSWVPGYVSLFSKSGLADTTNLQLSDLSYRQNVEWSPDSLKGVHGKLYAQPFAKKLSDYYENGVDWGGGFDKTFDPWFAGLDGAMLSAWRHGLYDYNEYNLADRHAQVTEKYSIVRPVTLYVKETGGWAQQTGISAAQGWYYRIVPGLQWQVFGKGSIEASYAYSVVDLADIVDPRIAQGFTSGISHTIEASGHVNFASHFSLDLTYHGELGKNYYNGTGLHVLSMQMKAYL